MCALWCGVESLIFFKVPMCGGAVLWCGRSLNSSDFPGCGYCASMDFSTVVEKLFTFKKKSLCWAFSPVVERLIFSDKDPCAGDFLAPFGTKKETLIKSHLVKNFKAIF